MTPTLAMLLESAIRTSLLGVSIAVAIKLARLRDARAETMIWTTVLLAALSMPLLHMAMRGTIAVPLPDFFLPPATVTGVSMPDITPNVGASPFDWLCVHGEQLLWIAYGLIAALNLARLATGVILTIRIWRAATTIAAPWAYGRAIRASASVAAPLSFGTAILLPADYHSWPQAKLIAVLAHERSHVQRGDFFIQFAAGIYRALFWFSPFAWWLQHKLCELAETASDEAAVQHIKDRASYAEILIEVSRCASGLPAQTALAQVSMAKGPDIAWRVERILNESRERNVGATARLLAVSAILPAAGLIAGAQAAVPHTALPVMMMQPAIETMALAEAAAPTTPAPSARPAARPATAQAPHPVKRIARESVSYNPRALLGTSEAVLGTALIPTEDAKRKTKTGHDNAVILNPANFAE
jgi:beta-lactamase regulating signal transducer with metallopeptidase domain